jgi:hypothetical protein
MGEDPDNLEKIVVTKPTVIRVPANMWHGPVNFKGVGRPVFLEDPMFAGRAGSIKRRFMRTASLTLSLTEVQTNGQIRLSCS